MARILLVDDDAQFRQEAEEALRFSGHEVLALGSGVRALDAVDGPTFDLAIVDLEMPTVPGSEVVRAMVAGHSGERRPVILLVSEAPRDYVPRGLTYDAFIHKPCDAVALAEKVRGLLPTSDSRLPARRFRRKDVRIRVLLDVDGREFDGVITNLSIGGFQVEWDRCPFCPDEAGLGRCCASHYAAQAPEAHSVKTRIATETDDLDLEARWVYTTRDGLGQERAGFLFTGITPRALGQISEVFAGRN